MATGLKGTSRMQKEGNQTMPDETQTAESCAEHFHGCLSCNITIEGVRCDAPLADRFCSECKQLTHFERTMLRHANVAAQALTFMAEYDFGDEPEKETGTETVQ